jgi:hypothetical protein
MQNQNDSESTLETSNQEALETPTAPEGEKVEEVKGLSTRDALEVAIAATSKEPKPDAKPDRARADNIIKRSKDPKVAADSDRVSSKKDGSTNEPRLEAPAEYSRDEREDFNGLSRKQQEAALRLHKSRMSTLEQIKRESAELQWSRDIAKQVEPFLKVRGDKEPTHQQILKALKVINEIDDNPRAALAEIMRAKGMDVPKELLKQETPIPKEINETITPLQARLDALERKVAEEENQKVGAVYVNAFDSFASAKNAGGAPKYPDIGNTESGLRLASNIGTLVGGRTDLSKQFIASVTSRIPDASLETLYAEAYKFYGGKVDDTSTPRFQTTQNHLQKSNRAAASVPASGARASTSNGSTKLSYREALEKAIGELNQR